MIREVWEFLIIVNERKLEVDGYEGGGMWNVGSMTSLDLLGIRGRYHLFKNSDLLESCMCINELINQGNEQQLPSWLRKSVSEICAD